MSPYPHYVPCNAPHNPIHSYSPATPQHLTMGGSQVLYRACPNAQFDPCLAGSLQAYVPKVRWKKSQSHKAEKRPSSLPADASSRVGHSIVIAIVTTSTSPSFCSTGGFMYTTPHYSLRLHHVWSGYEVLMHAVLPALPCHTAAVPSLVCSLTLPQGLDGGCLATGPGCLYPSPSANSLHSARYCKHFRILLPRLATCNKGRQTRAVRAQREGGSGRGHAECLRVLLLTAITRIDGSPHHPRPIMP
ncbi:hypothetical protein V8C86DRAFT_2926140 [Haematococcus lacustris]